MIKYNKQNKKNSFSIFEISIVLVIVALMTTFVLNSTNMSNNAKLNSIMADVRYYAKQTDKFVEIYGGLPGDFANITILPNYGSFAAAGNGNGIIDTAQEARQYWVHLQLAGLITGYFDGTSATPYDSANSNTAGGFPLAKYPASVITVDYTSAYGLTYIFAQRSTAASPAAFLKPADAYSLDKKYDDANPDTGIIRAFNQAASTACKTSNTYTLATNSPSCYLKINIENKASTAAVGDYSTCNSSNFGASRISTTYTCPIGYTGVALDHCTSTGWVQVRKNCEPVSCGQGLTYGQTLTMPCAPGFTGTGYVVYTCGAYGVLYPTTETCSTSNLSICTAANKDLTRTFACPIGYSGTWSQTCKLSSGSYYWGSGGGANNTFNPNCTNNAIKCNGGSVALGSASNMAIASPCPLTSGTGWTANGTSVGVCSLPITDATTASSTNGTIYLAKTYCLANYAACAGNTMVNAVCPFGQTGTFRQTCNGAYYDMTSSDCVPANCGGEPVGAWRVSQNLSCGQASGTVLLGVVLEICAYIDANPATCSSGCHQAAWQISYAACN
jgi:hypothetical protein